MAHPYEEFEGSSIWTAIDEELAALERNSDVELTTARHLVVGALSKAIHSSLGAPAQLPNALLAEIDGARKAGAVEILMWDGERRANVYTILGSYPGSNFEFRRDSDDLARAVRECLVAFWAVAKPSPN